MSDDFLPYTFTLTVGDWSRDGHNMFDTITVKCNRNKDAVLQAWVAGMAKLDLKPLVCWPELPWCGDYQDSLLPNDAVEKLKAVGIDVTQFTAPWYKDESVLHIEDSECFVMLWMSIAWLGDDKIVYKTTSRHENNLNIGGYGLFHP